MVKNRPAMWETWVRSLGWEDPLEEGMTTHSSVLAWRLSMDRGAWRAIGHGVAESDMTEQPSTAQHKVTPNLQTSQEVSGPQPLSPFSFWCLLASPEDGVKK